MLKIWELIISAFTGAALALISNWIYDIYQRKSRNKAEISLIISEINDIIRHCEASLKVINKIEARADMVPSRMHFEKMKVFEGAILFTQESFRNISHAHAQSICRIKVVVRNLGIEVDAIVDYISKGNYNEEVMLEYIQYLNEKFRYAMFRLSEEKKKIEGIIEPVPENKGEENCVQNDNSPDINEDKVDEEKVTESPKRIIYEHYNNSVNK